MTDIDPKAVLRATQHWDKQGHYWYNAGGDDVSPEEVRTALAVEIKAHGKTRRMLRQYAHHRRECVLWGFREGAKCNCGLDDILAALEET